MPKPQPLRRVVNEPYSEQDDVVAGAAKVGDGVSIVFYTFTIEGLRRLLSVKSREIDELKASRNNA